MAVDWSLAYQAPTEMQQLTADSLRQRMAQDTADRARADAARSALSEYYRAGQAAPQTPSIPIGLAPGGATEAGGPSGATGPSSGLTNLMAAGRAAGEVGSAPSAPARNPLATLQRIGTAAASPGRQAAFDRLVSVDPEAAFKLRTQERADQAADRTAQADQVKAFHNMHSEMIQLFGGVRDQATYDQARARAQALYAPYGIDIHQLAYIPDQYSPEGLHSLQMQALETQQQLTQGLADQKAADERKWREAADTRADSAQRETMRHNRAAEGNAAGNLSLSRQRESRVTKWGPQPLFGGVRADTDDLNY